MYEKHFGLKKLPFAAAPDPEFMFWTRSHKRASDILELGASRPLPVTILTGELGVGKTTLVRHFRNSAKPELTIGVLSNLTDASEGLFHSMLAAFEQPQKDTAPRPKGGIDTFLASQHARGQRSLLIVDEAHTIADKDLEQLRILTSITAENGVLLRLMLVGLPQLRERLREPKYKQLVKRVGSDFHLEGISEEETAGYVRHRMKVAGGTEKTFSDAAIREVYRASEGVPRNINTLCDLCLKHTFQTKKMVVTAGIAKQAASDAQRDGVVLRLPQQGSPAPLGESSTVAPGASPKPEAQDSGGKGGVPLPVAAVARAMGKWDGATAAKLSQAEPEQDGRLPATAPDAEVSPTPAAKPSAKESDESDEKRKKALEAAAGMVVWLARGKSGESEPSAQQDVSDSKLETPTAPEAPVAKDPAGKSLVAKDPAAESPAATNKVAPKKAAPKPEQPNDKLVKAIDRVSKPKSKVKAAQRTPPPVSAPSTPSEAKPGAESGSPSTSKVEPEAIAQRDPAGIEESRGTAGRLPLRPPQRIDLDGAPPSDPDILGEAPRNRWGWAGAGAAKPSGSETVDAPVEQSADRKKKTVAAAVAAPVMPPPRQPQTVEVAPSQPVQPERRKRRRKTALGFLDIGINGTLTAALFGAIVLSVLVIMERGALFPPKAPVRLDALWNGIDEGGPRFRLASTTPADELRTPAELGVVVPGLPVKVLESDVSDGALALDVTPGVSPVPSFSPAPDRLNPVLPEDVARVRASDGSGVALPEVALVSPAAPNADAGTSTAADETAVVGAREDVEPDPIADALAPAPVVPQPNAAIGSDEPEFAELGAVLTVQARTPQSDPDALVSPEMLIGPAREPEMLPEMSTLELVGRSDDEPVRVAFPSRATPVVQDEGTAALFQATVPNDAAERSKGPAPFAGVRETFGPSVGVHPQPLPIEATPEPEIGSPAAPLPGRAALISPADPEVAARAHLWMPGSKVRDTVGDVAPPLSAEPIVGAQEAPGSNTEVAAISPAPRIARSTDIPSRSASGGRPLAVEMPGAEGVLVQAGRSPTDAVPEGYVVVSRPSESVVPTPAPEDRAVDVPEPAPVPEAQPEANPDIATKPLDPAAAREAILFGSVPQPPRIVIHHANEDRARAENLVAALREGGFSGAQTREVQHAVSDTNVRYFFADDVWDAKLISQIIARTEGTGRARQPREFPGYAGESARGLVEIWISN